MIIAFNKPYGILCQFTPDQPGQRTLSEFGFPSGVYPLGRLDLDSEGLLLLSDEPGINDRLLHPKNAHARSYLVQVEGIPDASDLKKLAAGTIIIQGHQCLPCSSEILDPQPLIPPREPPIRIRKSIPDTWIQITLTEGKNRQVRKMTAAIGYPTLRLIRISIGAYNMNDLKSGSWTTLEEPEIRKIWI